MSVGKGRTTCLLIASLAYFDTGLSQEQSVILINTTLDKR